METALEQLSKTQLIALVKKGERAVADRDRVIREKDAYEAQLLALKEMGVGYHLYKGEQ